MQNSLKKCQLEQWMEHVVFEQAPLNIFFQEKFSERLNSKLYSLVNIPSVPLCHFSWSVLWWIYQVAHPNMRRRPLIKAEDSNRGALLTGNLPPLPTHVSLNTSKIVCGSEFRFHLFLWILDLWRCPVVCESTSVPPGLAQNATDGKRSY